MISAKHLYPGETLTGLRLCVCNHYNYRRGHKFEAKGWRHRMSCWGRRRNYVSRTSALKNFQKFTNTLKVLFPMGYCHVDWEYLCRKAGDPQTHHPGHVPSSYLYSHSFQKVTAKWKLWQGCVLYLRFLLMDRCFVVYTVVLECTDRLWNAHIRTIGIFRPSNSYHCFTLRIIKKSFELFWNIHSTDFTM